MPAQPIRASDAFHAKLNFVLRALSMSHGAAASKLAVHKSLVGRWVSGAVRPSRHNLSRLSAMVAERIDGFSTLDWDLPFEDLTRRVATPGHVVEAPALTVPMFEEAVLTTRRRSDAYRGFFRSTRPYTQHPGHFIHDYIMIHGREDDLAFVMVNATVTLEGRIAILQDKLFVAAAETASPTYGFAIFNGVNTTRAKRLDGIFLYCAFDLGRTPVATPVVLDRIGDLSADAAQNMARLDEMRSWPSLADPPPEIAEHLARDFGPKAFASGGEWLLQVKLANSLSSGYGLEAHGAPARSGPPPDA